MSLIMGVRDF